MSEEIKNPVTAQEELVRRLKAIGADLWGGQAVTAPEETAPAAANAGRTGKTKETSGSAPQVSRAKRKTGIENLWITADESVDWTEALLWDSPRDGLTGQKLWNFYHRMARRVLNGETDAYAEVLTTINPLGDLAQYVTGMILRTPGPERLECVFECQPDDLEKHGSRYLCALSLRVARDLLAVLPVAEVQITGNLEGKEKISVTFRREQLLKQKMAFLVPEEFTEACGGKISL